MADAAFTPVHERLLSPFEAAMLLDPRRRLLAAARGVVVELGGTGAGFSLYPAAVTRVVVVGGDANLVARSARRTTLPVSSVVRLADAGLGDGEVDTVVSVFTLCGVPDLDATLADVRRLLQRDGRLLFLEHVAARGPSPLRRAATPVWRQVTGGCDLARDVPSAIRGAGFTIVDIERFTVPTLNLPLRSCAIGAARPRRYDVTAQR